MRRALLRHSLVLAGLACLLAAAPASAAKVVGVRVGNHPTFTRVVFELDAPAGYRIEKSSEAGTKELIVTLEAESAPRSVRSGSPEVSLVSVQLGTEQTLAHIRLNRANAGVKELILSNPPRIVIDLMREPKLIAATRARAAKPAAARPAAQTKPPAPEIASEAKPAQPAPAPKPEAKPAPAPVIAAKPEAKPAPAPVIATKPEAKRAPAPVTPAKPEPVVAPKPLAKAEAPVLAPKPLAKAEPPPAPPKPAVEPPAPAVVPKPVVKAEPPAIAPAAKPEARELAPKPVTKLAEAPVAPPIPEAKPPQAPLEPKPEVVPALRPPAPAAKEAAAPAPTPSPALPEPAKPEAAKPGVPELAKPGAPEMPAPAPAAAALAKAKQAEPAPAPSGLPLEPMQIAALAGGLLLLVFLVIMMMRRRRLPNDLDVTALAEEDDGEPASITEGLDFGAGDRNADRATEPMPKHRAPEPPASAPGGLFADTDQDLFEKPEKGESKMSQDTLDLPVSRSQRPPATQATTASAGDSDIGRLVRELERRVAQLETRLDEANDARERLERQVAAQSEELRVQRAAIARTQRALRGMNRGEEEQATEPALRDPNRPMGGN